MKAKRLYVEKAMELALRWNNPEFASHANRVMLESYGSDAQKAIAWHEDNRRAFSMLKAAGTQVFRFDPDAQREIERTEGGMTEEEVRSFFPFDAAYVMIEHEECDGFVVIKGEGVFGFWPVLRGDYGMAHAGGESGTMVVAHPPFGAMVNLTAYIASANADINRVYSPSDPLPPGRSRRRSRATIHEVGYRIGAQLREYARSGGGGAGGGSVRPHMRRAHWHRFWTGPRDGERVLVARWLHPIFVNPGGESCEWDVPATLRGVPWRR